MVDRMLAGDPTAEGSAALTALLSAATAPGTSGELAGEKAVLKAFRAAGSGTSLSRTPSRARRTSVLSTFLAGKAVAAAAAGGIAIAGTAAAAYTGNLPDALQDVAAQTIGAPAADATDAPAEHPAPAVTPAGAPTSATPVGPDASGNAAFGLCTAWDKGGVATTSVAYDALVKAAGGENKIDAYCDSVDKPGEAAEHAATPSAKPDAKPTARPTAVPESHPSAPTTHATGAPADAPTPASPGAKPTAK
jgi:hypothetical protein